MKTTFLNSRPQSNHGSVLAITMCVVLIAALLIVSYLVMVEQQTDAVARSQTYNTCVSVAEAGIEEGLAMVNNGAPAIITSPYNWVSNLPPANWNSFNGWTTWNQQTYLSRYVSGSNYYTVTVATTNSSGNLTTPTITSVGVCPYTSIPWEFSAAPGPLFAAAGFSPLLAQASTGSSTQTTGRKIQVQTVLNPLFTAAIVLKTNLNLSGKWHRGGQF